MKIRLLSSLRFFSRRELALSTRFKLFLSFSMPSAYGFVLEKWGRNSKRLFHLTEVLVAHHGMVVMHGPFAGMMYVPCPIGINLVPKLLGCYEEELHGIIRQLIHTDYAEIINIGCSEGYYAIGLALRMPGVRVHAFDSNPVACQLCKDLARTNGVANQVVVKGECDRENLRTLPLEGAVVICDCEGYELELLRPDLISGLRTCDLLVELHDFFNPHISQAIIARFRATHDITVVTSTERNPAAYPEISIFSVADQRLAISEFRPGVMQWAFMKSRIARSMR